MSSMPEGWQDPKTNWSPEDPVGPGDLTRIERNAQAIELGDRTLDAAQAPTGNTGTLRQILSWIVNRIKAITGGANWWSTPATTLAGAKGHMDAAAPHSGHETPTGAQARVNAHASQDITSSQAVHGIRQGSGNGLDADLLDGGHWVIAAHDTITVPARQVRQGVIIPLATTPCWYQVDAWAPDHPDIGVYANRAMSSVPEGHAGWMVYRYDYDILLQLTNKTSSTLNMTYVVWVWSEA